MTTLTQTGKKKLVYRQDPDGVFRLKKVDTTATSLALSIRSKKDDELVDLSYKLRPVADPAVVPAPEPIEPIAEIEPVIFPVPAAGKLHRKRSVASSLASSDVATVDDAPKKSNPKHTLAPPFEPTPTHSPEFLPTILPAKKKVLPRERVVLETAPPATTPAPIYRIPQIKLPAFDAPKSMADQRVLSFVAGLITAFVIQRLALTLGHYALALLQLLKVLTLVAVVAGGASWYLGVVNASHIEVLRLRLTGRPVVVVPTSVAVSPAELAQSTATQFDYSDSDSDVSWPGVDSDDDRLVRASPKSIKKEMPLMDPPIRIPSPERKVERAKPVRKNTLTNIKPFVAPERRLPTRTYTADPIAPKSNRKNSITSIDMARGAHYDDLRGHSPVRHVSPNKRLPPYPRPSEDLPLVNEIKLLRKADLIGDDTLTPLDGGVARLGSVMSKTLVLGTRANYDKFLARAGEE